MPADVKMSHAEYMELPYYDEQYAASSPYGSRFRFWVHRNPDSCPRMATVGRRTMVCTEVTFDFVEITDD